MSLSLAARDALQRAHAEITFVCPVCKSTSAVLPPFNLTEFSCPECTKHLHPFVRFGDQFVDLVQLRGLLAAMYMDSGLARSVLNSLASSPYRAAALELNVPRAIVAAHAVVACRRHADAGIPWLAVVAGAIYPIVTAAAPLMGWHWSARRLHEGTVDFLSGPFSKNAFDPREIPDVAGNGTPSDLLGRLVGQTQKPRVIFEDALDSLEPFGTLESRWSIVIDTGKKRADFAETPEISDLRAFRRQVVDRVTSVVAEPREIASSPGEVMLMRGLLPSSNPMLEDGRPRQLLSEDQLETVLRDVRVKSNSEDSSIVESLDFRDGTVIRTCLSTDRAGRYVTVRWFTYVSRRAFYGAYLASHLVDPDRELAKREEKKAAAQAAGFLARIRAAIPGWLPPWIIGIPLLGGSWSVLNQVATAFTPSPIWERALYLVIAGSLALFVWWAARRPFPPSVLKDDELTRVQRRDRRVERAVEGVRRNLGRWTYAAHRAIGIQYRATVKEDRLARQRSEFLVYAHNRAVQDAIVEAAEARGIDMSEFKEGIAQFNNYGVISTSGVVAGMISGPVSVGEGAVARQQAAAAPRRPTFVRNPEHRETSRIGEGGKSS